MYNKKRTYYLFFALLTAAVLVFAGCGNKAKESGGKSKKETTETSPSKSGNNEIVIGVPGDPQNWDPIAVFLLDWSTVATSVFEGLIDRTINLELQPGLAEEWDYLDDTTLQFKLREGVEFHNGEPFNADAVKFTFDRLLGEEGAKGPQQANYTSIKEVEVVDQYTVKFHLNEPDPVLLTKLSGYGAVIVPPKYIQEHGVEHFSKNPVGTGPFKMTSYKQDSEIVLEKNDHYWKEGLPKLDKVTFRVIPEASTRLAELQTGNIDIMKRVEFSQVDSVKGNDSLELMEVGTPTAYSFRFDVDKKPVDDVRVRQAINYAIDKEAIISEILQGYGKMISSFQSELSFGYNPDLDPYPYDVEKAKELISEAGAEGSTLEIYVPGNDGTFKEIAQVVSYYLEEVGLKANIQTVDSNTFTSELIPNGKAGHMYRMGWGGWTLDFDNTAYLMYKKGEFWNPHFHDDKVDELLEAQRSTIDQEEREKIFKELTERLHELAPEVNLYSVIDLYAVNDHVQNFQPPHDDRLRLEEVTTK
ncbi:ABC transporter substrate-binding protein [Siminovitchia sp. 179-K 8D1 HS]|uniref:ABC transporter substrate-binding protein n=1 Tax=Siminovitchia sp. 179-K 8D1 HS TaxID=3142385 RepID=UPI0039A2C2F7